MKKLLLATIIALATVNASAETYWFNDQPTSDSIKISEVRSQLAAGKQVVGCQRVSINSRINPTPVKGSKMSYHVDLSGGLDDVAAAATLEKAGGSLFRCSTVVLSGLQVKTVR
jgi:hypothetical protein